MQANPSKPAPVRRVRVLRAFYLNGKLCKASMTLELPAIFAAEMIAAHKAEAIPDPAKPVAPADSTDGDLLSDKLAPKPVSKSEKGAK